MFVFFFCKSVKFDRKFIVCFCRFNLLINWVCEVIDLGEKWCFIENGNVVYLGLGKRLNVSSGRFDFRD